MEQEIDELRDLNVIDGDPGLVRTCDDQVLLLSPLQLQTPRGYAVDATAGEISVRKVRIHQDGNLEVRPGEVRQAEVRVAQVRQHEVRLAEVRPAEVRPEEVHLGEVRRAEVRPAEVRPAEVRLDEARHEEVRLAEVRPEEVRLAEVRPAEVRPAEVRPAEVRPAEVRPVEDRPAEVRPEEVHLAEVRQAEVRVAQVRQHEVRLAEVRPAERPAEVRPVEDRPAEVRFGEVWDYVGVLVAPRIPGSRPLHKKSDVIVVRHASPLLEQFASMWRSTASAKAPPKSLWLRRASPIISRNAPRVSRRSVRSGNRESSIRPCHDQAGVCSGSCVTSIVMSTGGAQLYER